MKSAYKFLFIFLFFLISGEALARIKLVTLPVRERVEIQLDHPEVTLVEEERIVPLVAGVNQVDFSWANTRIDPDTLVFRALPAAEQGPQEVNVLSVSYPPSEQALVWSVYASTAGAARVRISYLLGGLNKRFHYRAVAAPDETTLTLAQYMRIDNAANEGYEQTEVWAGFGEQLQKPIGINESKEVLVGKYRGVPITKTYTADVLAFGYLDPAQRKLNVPLHYVLKNTAANGLGQAALPYGKARIFQDDGRGGVAFLGEDWAKFTPLDDELSLYLGLARDIVVRRTIARNERSRIAGNLYNYDIVVSYDIENFKDTPARLQLIERVSQWRSELGMSNERDPQWELGAETTVGPPDSEKSDFDRLLFRVELPARPTGGQAEKRTHKLHVILQNEW